MLEAIEQYNNQGALLGIDGLDDAELLGALRKMNPVKRQKTINKLAQPAAPSRGSRAEMEKHFAELPQHIKDALLKGELRLADFMAFSIKPLNSQTIKIFEPQDDKEVGIRNLSNAKFPKNQAFLLSGITMLTGASADATKDKIMAVNFSGIENVPALAGGEFTISANRKIIVSSTSNYVFKTGNNYNTRLGYYKLANPRLIQDDLQIEMTVELGTLNAIPANSHIWVGLHGTITTP